MISKLSSYIPKENETLFDHNCSFISSITTNKNKDVFVFVNFYTEVYIYNKDFALKNKVSFSEYNDIRKIVVSSRMDYFILLFHNRVAEVDFNGKFVRQFYSNVLKQRITKNNKHLKNISANFSDLVVDDYGEIILNSQVDQNIYIFSYTFVFNEYIDYSVIIKTAGDLYYNIKLHVDSKNTIYIYTRTSVHMYSDKKFYSLEDIMDIIPDNENVISQITTDEEKNMFIVYTKGLLIYDFFKKDTVMNLNFEDTSFMRKICYRDNLLLINSKQNVDINALIVVKEDCF